MSITVWLELVPGEEEAQRGREASWGLQTAAPCGRSPASSTASPAAFSGGVVGARLPGVGAQARLAQREHFHRLAASPSPFPFLCGYFDNRPEMISLFPSIFSPSSVTEASPRTGSTGGQAASVHTHSIPSPARGQGCEQREPALACSLSGGGCPHREVPAARLPDLRPGLFFSFQLRGS